MDKYKFFTLSSCVNSYSSRVFARPHLQLTLGSLASSGVINAVLDYTRFDEQVAASAGVACTRALQNITAYMNEQLDKPLTAQAVKMRFSLGAHARLPATDGDFYYFLGDAMALAIQVSRLDAWGASVHCSHWIIFHHHSIPPMRLDMILL